MRSYARIKKCFRPYFFFYKKKIKNQTKLKQGKTKKKIASLNNKNLN